MAAQASPLDVSKPADRSALDIGFNVILDLVLRRTMLEEKTSLIRLSQVLGLSEGVMKDAFDELKARKLLDVQGMSLVDFVFSLTTAGREEARRRFEAARYAGPAPVALETYVQAVRLQRAAGRVNRTAIAQAFGDLVVAPELLDLLGPAFNAQHSLYLHGPSGTGKTVIAERLVRLYPDFIIVPRAVLVDGHFVVVYDPTVHDALPEQPADLDPRWVACRRPMVIAGRELHLDALSLRHDAATDVYTAPLHIKANNGILLIDDFGRQFATPTELVSRWIHAMRRRVDVLSLRNGGALAMPFELMMVFTSHLAPEELGDESFTRQVQAKLYVGAASEPHFGEILRRAAQQEGVHLTRESHHAVVALCQHTDPVGLRPTHAWDLVRAAKAVCEYEERPPVLDGPSVVAAARVCWPHLGVTTLPTTVLAQPGATNDAGDADALILSEEAPLLGGDFLAEAPQPAFPAHDPVPAEAIRGWMEFETST